MFVLKGDGEGKKNAKQCTTNQANSVIIDKPL